MIGIIRKLLNAPTAFRIELYPALNRAILKHFGAVLGDDVWVGAHCVVLKGVTIGARSIIGAGSVVTKNIPADCIAAGNPCKIIKKLS